MTFKFSNIRIVAAVVIVISIISITFFISCNKTDSIITDQNTIEITKTGCKTHLLTDSFNQDCIEYSFHNNTLHIKHINAAFNCCPNKVYAVASIANDTILITEKELLSQPCKCNCLYDIEYEINNVIDSSYIIVIKEPYVLDEAEKLIFNIYPQSASAGSFCKTRNTYPWGL
jgi:hypothetical protein